ncbi:hypothetical protein BKA70DRAFT_1222135 [Coprinopsis sp. MPI-PUGE-AT-0042]|nr:hypothetical protein BKA70DRAFT_1222135 [Coprinopsis sp. MPI-PUGE-AT-0042]
MPGDPDESDSGSSMYGEEASSTIQRRLALEGLTSDLTTSESGPPIPQTPARRPGARLCTPTETMVICLTLYSLKQCHMSPSGGWREGAGRKRRDIACVSGSEAGLGGGSQFNGGGSRSHFH